MKILILITIAMVSAHAILTESPVTCICELHKEQLNSDQREIYEHVHDLLRESGFSNFRR